MLRGIVVKIGCSLTCKSKISSLEINKIITSGDDHTCLICFEPKSTSTRLMEMSLLTSRVKWWVFGLGLKERSEDWTWFEEDAWRALGRWKFNLFNRDVLAAKGQVDRWQDDSEKFSDQYSHHILYLWRKNFVQIVQIRIDVWSENFSGKICLTIHYS